MPTMTVTEERYRRLSEQAARLHLTPEQLLERFLRTPAIAEAHDELAVPPPGAEEALAAVRRLSGLFAAVPLPDRDAALADPLMALANADIDDLRR